MSQVETSNNGTSRSPASVRLSSDLAVPGGPYSNTLTPRRELRTASSSKHLICLKWGRRCEKSSGVNVEVPPGTMNSPNSSSTDWMRVVASLRRLLRRSVTPLITLLLGRVSIRSEEHTSELQSLMRISYAVFCLKKQNRRTRDTTFRFCCR